MSKFMAVPVTSLQGAMGHRAAVDDTGDSRVSNMTNPLTCRGMVGDGASFSFRRGAFERSGHVPRSQNFSEPCHVSGSAPQGP